MAKIKIRNLNFSYDGEKILNEINLDFEGNKKTFILGGNGEGKTTLLEHLNGLLEPNKGKIYFNNQKITYDDSCLEKLREKVGLLFQNPDNQIVAPKVSQDIGVGPCNLKLTQEEVKERIKSSLQKLDIFNLKDRKTHNLSVGEKKKVCIAGLLAMEPSVLVLDEPISSLDPKSSEELMELINDLSTEGKTIIAATHKIDLAYNYADKIILMKDGEIKAEGNSEDVLTKEKLLNQCRLNFSKRNLNKLK